LETKGEFSLVYFIKNNPLQSFGILIFLGIFSFGSSLVVRRKYYQRKLKSLGEEEKLLIQLMAVVQRECFEKKKMSMEEYNQAMLQYEKRLSEAIEDKIKFETKLSNLFKLKGKKKALVQERERLVELVKGVQGDYLNKGKMDYRVYKGMLESYMRRLTEVEEEETFMDAEKALRENSFFRNFFRKVFGRGENEK
jgi:hypothetical protein